MKYLQFPDEKTARSATGWWSKEAGWIIPSPELQIAVRGVLYNSDGEYDEAGNVIKEPTLKDGYHIDVIYGLIPEAAQKFIINPSTPEYVLA
ncbi:hypothetical protein ABKT77_15130 [Enterobacter cloacae]|uniref:hypothetical protein n=1 Tax=Enterobacter cloacae TaxID=550 RepID=UPI0032B00CAC